MPSFGSMFASLTLESASFMSGIKAAQKELAKTQKTFAEVGAKMQKIGAVMTIGITAPFTALATSAIPAAQESAQALAQVNAALKSMGPVSGHTSEQLQALAGHLQDVSNFDDDDIMKSVTANLLTFGKVSGDVFDRAEQSIVDISARMGTDLQSATIMVGKALNAPVAGLKALSRAGIQFTDTQKEQIKAMVEAGNVAGAQKIMLGELEKQFGGAAAAQRAATPGAEAQQQWRTFQEAIGGVANDALPPLLNALSTVLKAFNELPTGVQTGVVGVVAFAAALGPVVATVGTLVTGIGAVLPALKLMKVAMMETAIPAVVSFGAALLPILAPLAAIAGAIALVKAAVDHWDEISAVVGRVTGYMAALYTGVKTWIVDKLNAVWNAVAEKVKWVADKFKWLGDVTVFHSYIPDMVDAIGQHMARLDAELVKPVADATEAASARFQELSGLMARLFPEQAAGIKFRDELALLKEGLDAGKISAEDYAAAVERLRTESLPGLTLTEDISGALAALNRQYPQMQAANDNLKKSFVDSFREASDAVKGLAETIRSGDFLDIVQSVLDTVIKLGSLGVFGKSISTRLNVPHLDGARAMGGPVLPGGSYLVGERGPEILRMGGSGGSIVPHDEIGGATVVQLVVGEGQLFEPRVTSISGAVSVQTVSGAQRGAARRARARLA